jgi:hypothetical protein
MNPIDCPTEALLEAHPSEVASPVDALALIIDPERALNAARRMELSCRNGLRFYSDFRRVRSLDEVTDEDDPIEIFDDSAYSNRSDFDPAFSRRA